MAQSSLLEIVSASTVISSIVGGVLTFWFERRMKTMEARIEEKMPVRQKIFSDKYTAHLLLSRLIEDCRYEIKHTLNKFKKKENLIEVATTHCTNLENLYMQLEDAFVTCVALIDKDLYTSLHLFKGEIEDYIPYLKIASKPDCENLDHINNVTELTYSRVTKASGEIITLIKQRLDMAVK